MSGARAGRAGAALKAVVNVLPDSVQARLDAWENTVTGLGTVLRDKRVAMIHRFGRELTQQELDAFYRDDDLAAQIIDTFPDEALREGYRINIQPEDEGSEGQDGSAEEAVALGEELRDDLEMRFATTERFNEGWRWGRLFGGGGLYMGIDDGAASQEEPLNEDRIRRVLFLHPMERRDFTPIEFFDTEEDTDSPQFGEPKIYLLGKIGTSSASVAATAETGIRVHASRVITFPGARTTRQQRRRNGGWDDSVLQRLHETHRDFTTAWHSVAHTMADGNQAAFKIKGLMEMIAGGNKKVLQDRMELMDYCRSVVRAIMLDADGEEFERTSTSYTGIPEILDRFMMRMSSATGIPVTLLMGRSPAGMNATGDSDFRAFFGRVKTMQEQILQPRLERWVRLNMLAREGVTRGQEPERWGIEFPPLWQMSPKEEAEIRKQVAETDQIYILNGVVTPEDVQASRFRPEGFSAETAISAESDTGTETPEEMEARIRSEFDLARAAEPGADPAGGTTDLGDPKFVPNGAQITAMIGVVTSVVKGELSRESGVEILTTAYPIDAEQASRILGPEDFEGPGSGGAAPQQPPPPVPPPPSGDDEDEEEDDDDGE